MCLLMLGVAFSACSDRDTEPAGPLRLGLNLPLAEFSEVRSLGLFALSAVPPELECRPYLEGQLDPLAELPGHLVASELTEVSPEGGEISLSFRDIPTGERTILVECYDSGGSRIFVGCGQTTIEAGRASELLIEVVEDRLASDPR